MFRCFNCRHVFSDYLTMKTDEGTIRGCPWCGVDDMAEVFVCRECGRYFEEADLYGGMCLECVTESIDYSTGLTYLLARDYLESFMVEVDGEVAQSVDKPILLKAFLVHENEDQTTGRDVFLRKLRDFILEDMAVAGDYARFMVKEAKK